MKKQQVTSALFSNMLYNVWPTGEDHQHLLLFAYKIPGLPAYYLQLSVTFLGIQHFIVMLFWKANKVEPAVLFVLDISATGKC